jgi:hypothetical protein
MRKHSGVRTCVHTCTCSRFIRVEAEQEVEPEEHLNKRSNVKLEPEQMEPCGGST